MYLDDLKLLEITPEKRNHSYISLKNKLPGKPLVEHWICLLSGGGHWPPAFLHPLPLPTPLHHPELL